MILDRHGNPILSGADAGPARGQGGVGRPRPARFGNPITGGGGPSDKDIGGNYVAYRMPREEAQNLYVMSWAAAKMVDIPIDDMFWKGRRFTGDDESAIKAFQKAEDDLGVMAALSGAMKTGQIFGSSLLIMCPLLEGGVEGDMSTPFDPDQVREGGLANLWSADRWACSVLTWQTSPFRPHYGKVYQYRVNGRIFGSPSPTLELPEGSRPLGDSGNYTVHRDRVFRFDGILAPMTEGWVGGPWEREWGISVFTRAVDAILRHNSIHANVGHLVHEASVWVQKIHGFKEAIKSRPKDNAKEPTVDDIAGEQSMLRSIYRTQFMDAEDEADRIAVSWAGLPDVMDKANELLAAIADIPMTRWNAQSPAGMNATGKSDADNYATHVAAMQTKMLDPVLQRLDLYIARHAGLREAPEYEWIPLTDISESEQSEIDERRTRMATEALNAGAVDEPEVRERLSQIEWWGELSADFSPPPSVEDELARTRLEQMQGGGPPAPQGGPGE